MTSILNSFWEYLWGDAEKKQLLEHLLSQGVSPNDAIQAVKLCPRTKNKVLLLQYMIVEHGANPHDAVQAVLHAQGNVTESVLWYNQHVKQTKLIQQFTKLGIPATVARQVLEQANWDAEVAQENLALQKKRELEQAKREYENKKAVYHRLVQKPLAATKAKPNRQAKYERPFRKMSSKKKTVYEPDVSSDEDDVQLPFPTIPANVDQATAGYHSSDDSENGVVLHAAKESRKSEYTPKKKLPGTKEKRLIFVLRQKISPSLGKQLAQALQALDKDTTNFVSGCHKLLQQKPEFGAHTVAAQFLHLLCKYPSLRDSVQRTLENHHS